MQDKLSRKSQRGVNGANHEGTPFNLRITNAQPKFSVAKFAKPNGLVLNNLLQELGDVCSCTAALRMAASLQLPSTIPRLEFQSLGGRRRLINSASHKFAQKVTNALLRLDA
jgi:hypothetical protein